MRSLKQRFESKTLLIPFHECWEWVGCKRKNGYGALGLGGRGGGERGAHRVSYEIFNGQIPDGLCVMHRCDNRGCVNPHHLSLGSHKENTRDCISKGRFRVRKLSIAQVSEIRRKYSLGKSTYRGLAREFDTTKSNIEKIVKGETWPQSQ